MGLYRASGMQTALAPCSGAEPSPSVIYESPLSI